MPASDLRDEIRKMNPTLFDPNTPQQRSEAFVQDLLYYPEFDAVQSMHNALVRPDSFIPPPRVEANSGF